MRPAGKDARIGSIGRYLVIVASASIALGACALAVESTHYMWTFECRHDVLLHYPAGNDLEWDQSWHLSAWHGKLLTGRSWRHPTKEPPNYVLDARGEPGWHVKCWRDVPRLAPGGFTPQLDWMERVGFAVYHDANADWDGFPENDALLVSVPLWAVAVVFAMPLLFAALRLARRMRRVATGRCAFCAYDLRASSDHCPECGRASVSGRPKMGSPIGQASHQAVNSEAATGYVPVDRDIAGNRRPSVRWCG